QRHPRQRRHSGGRYRVLSQFHAVRSVGPPRGQRRGLALCRWGHAVRARYRAARRRHPAGRRLERHGERGMGRATGGTTWLIYYRSRKVILPIHAGRRRMNIGPTILRKKIEEVREAGAWIAIVR